MTFEQVPEVIDYCRKHMCTPDGGRNCFLCERVPKPGEEAVIGLFIANRETQRRIGAPPNKTRLLI
jgi:hypothetical protein